MKILGKVKNGVVVLPAKVQLQEGSQVEVICDDSKDHTNPFLEGMLRLAKARDWPEDFALNHGHYVKGHPKKK